MLETLVIECKTKKSLKEPEIVKYRQGTQEGGQEKKGGKKAIQGQVFRNSLYAQSQANAYSYLSFDVIRIYFLDGRIRQQMY